MKVEIYFSGPTVNKRTQVLFYTAQLTGTYILTLNALEVFFFCSKKQFGILLLTCYGKYFIER
jgi:hypothetical protein